MTNPARGFPPVLSIARYIQCRAPGMPEQLQNLIKAFFSIPGKFENYLLFLFLKVLFTIEKTTFLGMDKDQMLNNTIKKLRRLDEDNLQEAKDFVEFLLTKVSDRELTKEIQKQAESGNSFDFLEEEEELYSVDDLKEVNKK